LVAIVSSWFSYRGGQAHLQVSLVYLLRNLRNQDGEWRHFVPQPHLQVDLVLRQTLELLDIAFLQNLVQCFFSHDDSLQLVQQLSRL
jgi:hypothetical protein